MYLEDEKELSKHVALVIEQNRRQREEIKQRPQIEQKKITLQSSTNTCYKNNERCKCHIL
jgi:hypothetical protein